MIAALVFAFALDQVLDQGVRVTSFRMSEAMMPQYLAQAGPRGYRHHACTLEGDAEQAVFELRAVKLAGKVGDHQLGVEETQRLDQRILQMEQNQAYYGHICRTGS